MASQTMLAYQTTYIKDEGDVEFGSECPVFPSNCRYKVTSVTINGRSITALVTEDEELLCFPQLVDYFLKDHVAGMPTIYAKVKRMGIIARSCNLDQVRLMRSMGAIGPVVNRCKLITMDDFKRLYEDCLLFRGPGRRKRISTDSSSGCTPVKITIKRPYLEENEEDDSSFGVGRKPEEEMVVNVSSPIDHHGSYFTSEFSKPNDGHSQTYRRSNGFSSEDKLGLPSMIYSTFSHAPPNVATFVQTFDSRTITTTSPRTTLITPINGATSPVNGTFDHQSKADNSDVCENDSNIIDMNDQGSAVTPISPRRSSSASAPTTPNSIAPSDSQKASPIVCGVLKTNASTNVIFSHVNGNNPNCPPRYFKQSSTQNGSLPILPLSHMRPQREKLTSSETLLGNIQGLLKVTSDNIRMVERQMMVDRDEFTKELQKESEDRIKATKMISDLQKDKALLQRKIRRLKKTTRKLNNHYQAAEQRCLALNRELEESSYASLREQNELLKQELEKERLTRIDAEKKLEGARGGIQNFVHNFLENPEQNSGDLVPV